MAIRATKPTSPGRRFFTVSDYTELTTDEPTSTPKIGWAHTYGKSRVFYMALGHDHFAYENPNYRQLVHQAIRWVARAD